MVEHSAVAWEQTKAAKSVDEKAAKWDEKKDEGYRHRYGSIR